MGQDMGGVQNSSTTKDTKVHEGLNSGFLRVPSCPWWCKPFFGHQRSLLLLSQSSIEAQRGVSLHQLPIAPQFPKCLPWIKPLLMLRDDQAPLVQ